MRIVVVRQPQHPVSVEVQIVESLALLKRVGHCSARHFGAISYAKFPFSLAFKIPAPERDFPRWLLFVREIAKSLVDGAHFHMDV
jgi:hypothetical protein